MILDIECDCCSGCKQRKRQSLSATTGSFRSYNHLDGHTKQTKSTFVLNALFPFLFIFSLFSVLFRRLKKYKDTTDHETMDKAIDFRIKFSITSKVTSIDVNARFNKRRKKDENHLFPC